MRVGIIGMPGSGKTALFRAVAHGLGHEEHGAHIAVVQIPDERFDWLIERYHPKKATPATIEFVDPLIGKDMQTRPDDKRRDGFSADFFADIRNVDALVHVVRLFTSEFGEPPAPVKDARDLSEELILADLQVVEKRLSRLEKALISVRHGAVTPETIERDLLIRIRETLESGKRVDSLVLTADEERMLRGFAFLTQKPQILVANVPEADIRSEGEDLKSLRAYAAEIGVPVLVLTAEIEAEIAELSESERAEYLEAMGLEEPASRRLVAECSRALRTVTFFTLSEPEIRAWTIAAGSHVIDAAEKIHSDMARGFIRAEVASFDDVKRSGGWEEAKRAGLVQLRTKDYIVQDGDIIYIRFKV